jgi:hypothetical protein
LTGTGAVTSRDATGKAGIIVMTWNTTVNLISTQFI